MYRFLHAKTGQYWMQRNRAILIKQQLLILPLHIESCVEESSNILSSYLRTGRIWIEFFRKDCNGSKTKGNHHCEAGNKKLHWMLIDAIFFH